MSDEAEMLSDTNAFKRRKALEAVREAFAERGWRLASEPHPFTPLGIEGAIGGPCGTCGHSIVAPWHESDT